MRRTDARSWLWRCALIGAAIAPAVLSGCSVPRFSNPFGSSEDDGLPPQTSALETARVDLASLPTGYSANCPQVVAWPRDRLLTIYQPDKVGDTNAVVHRGEITKMARECQLFADRVVVKYGFAGRVLLGPKGGPGAVTLGVTVRAAGLQQNTLASDKMKVTASVAPGQSAGYFSLVREISFPVAVGTRPQDYKIFVAFDRNVAGAG
ncbi:MAG: hypothetical protein AB7G54_03045 [Methyloceanibacter sp.]